MEILIRPEGLRLTLSGEAPEIQAGDGPQGLETGPETETRNGAASPQQPRLARALSARPLGRSSHVELAVADGQGSEIILEARVPGVFLPARGEKILLSVNPRQAHVFPVP